MKITGLSAQQKDPSRVNVMVDGKFRFSLDVSQITSLGIKVGCEYSDAELAEFETESQFGKLYARALEYCLMRPHSVREVRDYLYRKTQTTKYKSRRTGEVKERPGVSQTIASRVFDRLSDRGYVDDEKFAVYWVENRNQRKGTSIRKLRAELASKGVSHAAIEQALAVSDRSDQSELQKVIDKKRARYPDKQKFIEYLARQGFRYDDIQAALVDDD